MGDAARALIQNAALIVGGHRHLALLQSLIQAETLPWPRPIERGYDAILARRSQPVVVLASGDPFWFGVASALGRLVPSAEISCIPAPSAFSLACARLGWAVQDCITLSFCARPLGAVLPLLQPGRKMLALSQDRDTPAQFASLLRDRGFGVSVMHILETLGGPRERLRSIAADRILPEDIDPLNMIAVELQAGPDARILPLSAGMPDAWFEHDGQITKQMIRAATLAALQPHAGEMLWDIGAGSGSVGIEWCLRGASCRAMAIEPHPDRAARIRRNAEQFGVIDYPIVQARAPDGLAGLPTPQAVFIGGGASASVIKTAWTALPAGGRLVVNAVTTGTEALLFAEHARRGGTLRRLRIEQLEPIGAHQAFRPTMPVTQWAITR